LARCADQAQLAPARLSVFSTDWVAPALRPRRRPAGSQIVIVRLGDSGERPLDSSRPQPQPDRSRSTIVGMVLQKGGEGGSMEKVSLICSQPLLPQVVASFACAATDLTAGNCWYGSQSRRREGVGPNQARQCHEVSRVQFHRCPDAWVHEWPTDLEA